jgi:hypothetical protein
MQSVLDETAEMDEGKGSNFRGLNTGSVNKNAPGETYPRGDQKSGRTKKASTPEEDRVNAIVAKEHIDQEQKHKSPVIKEGLLNYISTMS